MENKHKNALIGGLLAIVFIMAVGFAGFTQRLTINETSTVGTNWNVGFESVTPSAVCQDGVATACGTVTGFTAQDKALTLNTKLTKPTDTITYTIVVKNYGDVDAKIAADGVKMTPTNTNSVITYTQEGLTAGSTTLTAGASANFTITVTFPQTEGNVSADRLTNGLTFYIDWEQA